MALPQADHSRLPDGVTKAEILSEVARICRNPRFSRAQFLCRFLTYTVEQVLSGEVVDLKEYSIATYVFGRAEGFDPRNSSIVRTQASKLRQRLAEYYNAEGLNSPFYISFPVGSYAPVFSKDATASHSRLPAKHIRQSAGRTDVSISVLAIVPAKALMAGESLEAAEDLANRLTTAMAANYPQNVLANSIAGPFGRSRENMLEFSDRLTIDYLAEIGVHSKERSRQVSISLLSCADGTYRWVKTFDWNEPNTGQFLVTLAAALTAALGSLYDWRFAEKTKPLGRDHCAHICEEGAYAMRRLTAPALDQAERVFQRAKSLDPLAAQVYAGLSLVGVLRILMGLQSVELSESDCRVLAARAVALDRAEPLAILADAAVMAVVDWNFPDAAHRFAAASQVDSDGVLTESLRMLALSIPTNTIGESTEVLREITRKDRGAILARYALAMAYLHSGALREAENEFRGIIDAEYLCGPAWRGLWRCLVAQGQFSEAARVTQFVDPHTLRPASMYGLQAALEGYQRNWAAPSGEAHFSRELELAARLASLRAEIGPTAALAELERSVRLHDCEALTLKTDPLLSELRSDFGFQALLRRFDL